MINLFKFSRFLNVLVSPNNMIFLAIFDNEFIGLLEDVVVRSFEFQIYQSLGESLKNFFKKRKIFCLALLIIHKFVICKMNIGFVLDRWNILIVQFLYILKNSTHPRKNLVMNYYNMPIFGHCYIKFKHICANFGSVFKCRYCVL